MSILEKIAEQRRARIAREGHAMGVPLPATRQAPLVPFGAEPFLICEIKRGSPSRGAIAPGLDAAAQARLYVEQGARNISVLTEKDGFDGSLADLVRVKAAFPGIPVLRKDFLLDEEDIDVSWRAGADAVLLIAALLDASTLARLYRRARSLGMRALVEVHDEPDIAKARPLAPGLTGINSRDLATFSIDRGRPLRLRRLVDWTTRLVFESGIRAPEDVRVARSGGFSGVLVGETAVRTPDAVAALADALQGQVGDFWARLYARKRDGRPLVKVCGITRARDAEAAVALGADVLGFVFAESRRRADPAFLAEIAHVTVPKVAVVVGQQSGDRGDGGRAPAPRLDPAVEGLLAAGLVDAVQFHGNESPEDCPRMAFPYYKAVRVGGIEDIAAMDRYRSPRVLCDAFSPNALGGTGTCIPEALVRAAAARRPLWLAGGVGAENVGEIIERFQPELLDASSKLEEAPGCKDNAKLRDFFREVDRHAKV